MIPCQQFDNGLNGNVFFDYLLGTMRTGIAERAITTGSGRFRVEEWMSFQNLGRRIQQSNIQEIS